MLNINYQHDLYKLETIDIFAIDIRPKNIHITKLELEIKPKLFFF